MTNYDELAVRAERGELPLIPGTQRRGHAARAETRAMLMDATGTDSLTAAIAVALGRPRLNE
ncbi:hypothetical protein [Clavibacter michiganensis]|uniref:hypothetical protein n=1 Tax=Clavibacter michiganensis TaxID=28447 RepID=UPI001365B9A0|nr:hypothetical protein [Clavibacter michiganensis]MDO4019987.1 hypothetical protein [Clavibacter michiganensis]MDO4039808.1 hypothetical protein [Clavibacter michiganensis]MDO4052015.1 hypothetical protein [Clavibacter michiganensis]MDO4064341.1 hypothetical protein [Clavibacter michiganensis]MDO4085987.1 hypothetical protein [Clavibacter michiganensis]